MSQREVAQALQIERTDVNRLKRRSVDHVGFHRLVWWFEKLGHEVAIGVQPIAQDRA
jgi:predicted XRE-type DNA-binding protein